METGTIQVTAEYPALGFFYAFLTPNIVIDGALEKRPWGTYLFRVVPGRHVVEISYPWLFVKHAGKSTAEVFVGAGQTVRIRYKASMIRYIPGTMSVDAQLPEARVIK